MGWEKALARSGTRPSLRARLAQGLLEPLAGTRRGIGTMFDRSPWAGSRSRLGTTNLKAMGQTKTYKPVAAMLTEVDLVRSKFNQRGRGDHAPRVYPGIPRKVAAGLLTGRRQYLG